VSIYKNASGASQIAKNVRRLRQPADIDATVAVLSGLRRHSKSGISKRLLANTHRWPADSSGERSHQFEVVSIKGSGSFSALNEPDPFGS
jgi:hypothetical protein